MQPDRFTAMNHFVRIVEKGSLTAAARDLGKTLPALSRSLRFLEERLGARLLTRTTRAIALTEFGQQYYEHCRRILRDIEEAEGLAGETGHVAQGLIRIKVEAAARLQAGCVARGSRERFRCKVCGIPLAPGHAAR